MEINISKINFAGSGGVCPPCPEYKSQEKSVEITENGPSTVSPDAGYDGLSEVSINVAVPIPQLQAKNFKITSNGNTTITVDEGYDGISGGTINVNVPTPSPTLQEKSVSISQNGQSSVTPDSGFDGLSKVDISVSISNPPTTYDISLPYVSLAYSTLTEVPSFITGWEKLTSGDYKCQSANITSFNNDLSNLQYAKGLFKLSKLQTFSGDLSNLIENAPSATNNPDEGLFYQSNLSSFQTTNLDKLVKGNYMFYYCSNLKDFNTELPNLEEGGSMFYYCSNLSSWNIELPKLTDSSNMFTSSGIINWNIDLPNLTFSANMFSNCSNLETFTSNMPLLKSSNYMFQYNYKLTSFTSDLSSLTSADGMFTSCSKLTNITLTGTLNCDLRLSYSNNITVDSLMSVINALVDLTGQDSKTLTLGSTNLEKLSEEQKAVATNKNWVLS